MEFFTPCYLIFFHYRCPVGWWICCLDETSNTRTKYYFWLDRLQNSDSHFFYFSSQYSSSLLMMMTIEKCFAFYLPLKSKIVCTARNTKRICVATGILLFAFNLQLVFLNKFVTDSIGEIMCVFVGVHEDYEKNLLSDWYLFIFLYSYMYHSHS